MSKKDIKLDQKVIDFLKKEAKKRDIYSEVSEDKPDPILVVRDNKDEVSALICALFAYGKASLIVKFLKTIDFNFSTLSDNQIKKDTKKLYYRFQKSEDISQFFITLKRVLNIDSLENIFYEGYKNGQDVNSGIDKLIETFNSVNTYSSKGYNFLIGDPLYGETKKSPRKRWNLYLRWMVRKDSLDFGLWKKIDKKDLIIPLDTHVFSIAKKIKLLDRKSYNLQAAIDITETLKTLDPKDPVKFDMALYRVGQEGILDKLLKN